MTTKATPTPGPAHARLVDFLKEVRRITREDPKTKATATWCDSHIGSLVLGTPVAFADELTYPERQALREWLQRWRDDEDTEPGLKAWCADQFAALTAEGVRKRIKQREREASLSRLLFTAGFRQQ